MSAEQPQFPLATPYSWEISTLTSGVAQISFPQQMSPEDVSDLDEWLNQLLKKLHRRYDTEKKDEQTND